MKKHETKSIETPWAEDIDQILKKFSVDPEAGLNNDQVKQLRNKYGRNQLKEVKKKSAVKIFINQFKSLVILILIAASILAFIFTSWIDGLAIAFAVILNTVIGFFMEIRAVRSMEALQEMEQITANVLRDGQINEIHAAQLVPGDIVVFEGGDIVSADLRLIDGSNLQADESMLTGESMPVSKQNEKVEEDVQVSEKTNMLFKGTSITRGSGKAVVVAIGMNTELGRISSLIEESGEEFTPLEERLKKFGQKLIWITFAVLVVVLLLGIVRGKELLLMIETAVALAVAAIPEGLPIVATVAMARGMLRMAKHNALINKLAAVETLGGTNVIITDKTGTLTKNKMTVTEFDLGNGRFKIEKDDSGEFRFTKDGQAIEPQENEILLKALQIGVLCNNESLNEQDQPKGIGDPMEGALLVAGVKGSIRRRELVEEMPEEREEAFDTSTKKMATFHKTEDGFFVAVKGAPEAVLDVCQKVATEDETLNFDNSQKESWLNKNTEMASNGLRVLAVAYKIADSADADPYQGLTLLGLVGMMDPIRDEVKSAIGLCKDAGLKVIMVTGDQAPTALNIAKELKIAEEDNEQVVQGKDIEDLDQASEEQKRKFMETSVFARVNPEQKLNLVKMHQSNGAIVAMTGDGVNDAPGLQEADIGVAMGQHGTQVAREASDMVLKDDSFSSIVEAIKQGRIIFKNIRKFIIYLFSGNASQILIVFIASLFNAPLPILPLQILLLNIISDVFPALALGLGGGSNKVMEYPPRDPQEPILTKENWGAVFGYGLLIAAVVLSAFALSFKWLNVNLDYAVTISFLTLAFARLWHIFNMRDSDSGLIKNEIVKNKYVWWALIFCSFLLIAVVYTPGINKVLSLKHPSTTQWIFILGLSLIPFIVGQLVKFVEKNFLRR